MSKKETVVLDKYIQLSDEELVDIKGGNIIGKIWGSIAYGSGATTHAKLKYGVPDFTGH